MFFREKKQKKALVLWYPVDLNYGDYLIFQTVKRYLEEWGYLVEGMDVGLSYKTIAKKARKKDILWFAGGGIIERGIPDIIRNFPDFHKKSKQIMYGVTGLSIGQFDYSAHNNAIKYWVKNASFFYSRDSYTAIELNRISESPRVIDGVDVVFGNCELSQFPIRNDGRVGINLRDLPYKDLSGEFEWSKWERMLKKTFPGNLVGIPDQHDCLKKMDIPFDVKYCPEKVTEILQDISFTVSMRFHVILVAAIMGKVSVPISYCPKVSRLAVQLGIDDLELGVHDYAKLEQVVNRYVSKEEEYKEVVSANVKELQQRAKKMFSEVEHILKGDI